MQKELRQISKNINVGKSKFINVTHRDMKRALALFFQNLMIVFFLVLVNIL